MSERFEELKEMAKKEFGLNIVHKKRDKTSFESLFGISIKTISEFEPPYELPDEETIEDKKDERI